MFTFIYIQAVIRHWKMAVNACRIPKMTIFLLRGTI